MIHCTAQKKELSSKQKLHFLFEGEIVSAEKREEKDKVESTPSVREAGVSSI